MDIDQKEKATVKNRMLNNDPPGRLEVEEFKRRMAMTRRREEIQAGKGVKDPAPGILVPKIEPGPKVTAPRD